MKAFVLAIPLAMTVSLAMPNTVLAKGGHGWGHGHGKSAMSRGYGHGYATPPGWHHGRKVGWRGYGCPPGQWKKGRC